MKEKMSSNIPKRVHSASKISRPQLTDLQILLQMGFSKIRAEKALAATGNKDVQAAADWLLSHVSDPLLDVESPREYTLYACPVGALLDDLQLFWLTSRARCSWNGAHNYMPHITLVSFFKTLDQDAQQLVNSLRRVMEKQGAVLNELLKLEIYTSQQFMGFLVTDEHSDYLKRVAMMYVKEISNVIISDTYENLDALTACFPWCTTTTARCIPRVNKSINLEPYVKSLHLTLAYQFATNEFEKLRILTQQLDPNKTDSSSGWELRLYSRDPRINGKNVYKIIKPYVPVEADELELRSNDFIYIHPDAILQSVDGWAEGISWLTGITGTLPINHIERTAESDAWTLHAKVPLTTSIGKLTLSNLVQGTSQNTFSKQASKSDYKQENKSNYLLGQCDLPLPENKRTGRVILMNHAESMDSVFRDWTGNCFSDDGIYRPYDLNMPKHLPERAHAKEAYKYDTPLTNVGVLQARSIGNALKHQNIIVDVAYTSPDLCCIQTCDAFLDGMQLKEKIEIRVEPSLFEWTPINRRPATNIPTWLTVDELQRAGYNVDGQYVAIYNAYQLHETYHDENIAVFLERQAKSIKQLLENDKHNCIIFIGHASTILSCSWSLLGSDYAHNGDTTEDKLLGLISKVPSCALVHLIKVNSEDEQCNNDWKLIDPPVASFTHGSNSQLNINELL